MLVVLVAALVVGASFLIIRFDDSYDNATVEYVVIVDKSVAEGLSKGDNVYIDKPGSVIYMGNVIDIHKDISVERPDVIADGYVALTIRASVQYRDGEGYNIDGEKIAVGRDMTIRINNSISTCEIVELVIIEDTAK